MLTIDQASAERSTGGGWAVVWHVRNPGPEPVTVLSAWLPHGRFRSAEWRVEPPLAIPAGGEALLDSTVAWEEAPGTVVENGFLILRLDGGRRVFARLRITAGADGAPHAVCDSVT